MLNFTLKYTIVGGEERVVEILLRLKSHSFGNQGSNANFQNPRITPSGGKTKFTLKYTIVGGEEEVL
jgi:hypothetical protein